MVLEPITVDATHHAWWELPQEWYVDDLAMYRMSVSKMSVVEKFFSVVRRQHDHGIFTEPFMPALQEPVEVRVEISNLTGIAMFESSELGWGDVRLDVTSSDISEVVVINVFGCGWIRGDIGVRIVGGMRIHVVDVEEERRFADDSLVDSGNGLVGHILGAIVSRRPDGADFIVNNTRQDPEAW